MVPFSMMAGLGSGAVPLIHGAARNRAVDTGWEVGLLGIFDVGIMFNLGGNSVGVSSGTLGDGTGQSGWNTTAGAGRGALGA